MQQSNTYVIVFTAIMTLVIAGTLSLANQVLRPAQERSIQLDTRTQILSAVMDLQKEDDVLAIYSERIVGVVVNNSGEEVTTDSKGNPIEADAVNVLKNSKLPNAERELPVFKYVSENDSTKVEGYIFPMYGNGLWNKIYGFIALEADLNTIKGISFGHVQETPGLGARISSKDIQDRYNGKKIFDESGNLVSVVMLKGEKGDPSLFGPHQVDGMSGATLTGNGVNDMLEVYLKDYEAFIKDTQSSAL